MRLTFLGTGGAEVHEGRKNTSLLYSGEGTQLMIDCSGTPLRSVIKAGVDPNQIEQVLLTHAHTDHLYGVPSLVHMLWQWGGISPGKSMTFLGTVETLRVASTLIDAFKLREKRNAVDISFHELSASDLDLATHAGDCEVYSFPVTHGGIEALGYEFRSGTGKRIVYSGDAWADENVETRLHAGNVGLLVHDCGGGLTKNAGHAGVEEIVSMVQPYDVDRLALTHIPRVDDRTLHEIRAYAADRLRGEVLLPSDNDSIVI